MAWTQSQQQAIDALDGDLCVSAGAGCGKTGVLVERCVQIVARSARGELPEGRAGGVRQLLVITFTEKATRELKQRLVEELLRVGLAEQRRQLETAYISTIHGFCSRVLRENPFEAGLDPEFRPIDEVEARRLLRRAFESAVAEAFPDVDREIVELVVATQEQRVFLTDARDPIAALAASAERELARWRGAGLSRKVVGQAWSGTGSAGRAHSRSVVTGLLATLCGDLSLACSELGRVAGLTGAAEAARRRVVELARGLPAFADAVHADAEQWCDAVAIGIEIEHTAKRARVGGVRGAIVGPEAAGAITRVRDAANRLTGFGAVDPVADEQGEAECRRFARLVLAMWCAYDALKRRESVVDHDDLQREAVRLLETAPDVLRRYRHAFRYVLVDEFQDTSPVQLRLVRLLGGQDDPPPDGVAPGVFIVGDVQQSIYGFRDAEPALFRAAVMRHRAGNGRHVGLQVNFRSRPEILRFVNGLFSGIWRETDPPFAALEPGGRFDDADVPSVEAIVGKQGLAAAVAAREASALAHRIGAIVRGGRTRISQRGHPRHGETVRYRDVAVLLRALTDIEHYERAFARTGIPYFVVGGGRGYYARHEVRDVVSLLRVLCDPYDDLALTALLRSPMFGLNCDTLSALAGHSADADHPAVPLLEAMGRAELPADIDAADEGRVRSAHATIVGLLDVGASAPVGRLLEEAVRRTEYSERLLLRPNGRRRAANVRKLVQMASDSDAYGPADFVSRLADLERVSDREGDAPTEEEAADVVRLLTIHKAKGLEFPVVAIAGMHRSPVRPERALFVSDARDLAVGCRLRDYTTAAYRALDARRRTAEDEESMRLLYVAMTRARERLILSGASGGGRGGPTWADIVFSSSGITAPQEPVVLRTPYGVEVAVWPASTPGGLIEPHDRRAHGGDQ
ncbi:MAG TPA: UvrD-helicase domain-containing protein [Chthonomonadales bacterium]|nr:UvrD-helicase domain-containing protein [Chthonomonadales bacterium]